MYMDVTFAQSLIPSLLKSSFLKFFVVCSRTRRTNHKVLIRTLIVFVSEENQPRWSRWFAFAGVCTLPLTPSVILHPTLIKVREVKDWLPWKDANGRRWPWGSYSFPTCGLHQWAGLSSTRKTSTTTHTLYMYEILLLKHSHMPYHVFSPYFCEI